MFFSKVISSIFFFRNKLFRMKELAVVVSSNFIDDSGFQINKDSMGDMFICVGFIEECVESIIGNIYRGVIVY